MRTYGAGQLGNCWHDGLQGGLQGGLQDGLRGGIQGGLRGKPQVCPLHVLVSAWQHAQSVLQQNTLSGVHCRVRPANALDCTSRPTYLVFCDHFVGVVRDPSVFARSASKADGFARKSPRTQALKKPYVSGKFFFGKGACLGKTTGSPFRPISVAEAKQGASCSPERPSAAETVTRVTHPEVNFPSGISMHVTGVFHLGTIGSNCCRPNCAR